MAATVVVEAEQTALVRNVAVPSLDPRDTVWMGQLRAIIVNDTGAGTFVAMVIRLRDGDHDESPIVSVEGEVWREFGSADAELDTFLRWLSTPEVIEAIGEKRVTEQWLARLDPATEMWSA